MEPLKKRMWDFVRSMPVLPKPRTPLVSSTQIEHKAQPVSPAPNHDDLMDEATM